MSFNRHLILASKSPRRQQLLKEAGYQFEVLTKEVDESFPDDLDPKDVAAYLSRKKADAFSDEINDSVLITADTVVKVGKTILNKPADENEAFEMLSLLNNRSHEVITGFTIKDKSRQVTKSCTTIVHFRNLTDDELWHYIKTYKPFDKAGAYGIQEWIGMVGIDKIEGSYFNVVGLPVHAIAEALKDFN
ncbi:Maf family protein [Fulvivirga lutea]|uniref:dTTP/UTP pyrophosphatase n=1 Tax=Fulvivirga lutea TaxID=2810512 RepID=A0A974WHV0_9BACT|nr:Maf family protein [Fulvivirga lutea]QSE96380.1 septum formation protein Maf [Fulvivirga lutea]